MYDFVNHNGHLIIYFNKIKYKYFFIQWKTSSSIERCIYVKFEHNRALLI